MRTKKDSVRLRQRAQATGNVSLYLDIYIDGRRSYEYLKLYLIPEKTREDKQRNRETLKLAEAIRGKRLVEVQNGKFGFESGFKLNTNFLEYYRHLCEERLHNPASRGNWGNWYSAMKHLERYCRHDMTFKEVTPEWIQGFKDYLNRTARVKDRRKTIDTDMDAKPLSQNSKVSYFNKLRACVNQAFEEGIIPRNPLRGIEGFKAEERERVYLTLGEVRALAAGECHYQVLKRAFLFSCLTGLRKSDIEKMRWGEVRQEGEYTRIVFKQKKTCGQEYLDINSQAAQYLGERGEDEALVFGGFRYSAYMLVELRAWALRCGITKHITFHTGRHTFAVLMLDLGADIYTVQKLLGHREIRTTEIYANIMDKKKQAAVSMIPDILPSVKENKE